MKTLIQKTKAWYQRVEEKSLANMPPDTRQDVLAFDAPLDKGHVVLFANNPVYRGTTIGSYFLVLNTILNFDNLNAGRVNAVR